MTQSPLPRALWTDATNRLPVPSAPVDLSNTPPPTPPVNGGLSPKPGQVTRAVRRARAAAIVRARGVLRRLSGYDLEIAQLRSQLVDISDEAAVLHGQFSPLSTQLQLDRTQREAERARAEQHWQEAAHRVEINRINLELMKGEVRGFEHKVEELGMAFAPAAGLAGAGARFAELREAVNAIERRLRDLPVLPQSAQLVSSDDRPGDTSAVEQAAVTKSSLFNYVGFERRFRGAPEAILADLSGKYAELLSAHQPVVDIGCGRAELLAHLAGEGVEVIGVEPDAGMVAEARARGVTVHQTLAGEYLRSVPDHSLGSIISVHVAEHLQLDDLIEMIELSVRKLKPGGVFIAETPNPSSLIVLGNSYILDPTHVWPLHPSLLSFLCESAGFRDVRLQFYSPAEGYHVGPIKTDSTVAEIQEIVEQVNGALNRLNEVLFGPQDYAVIATTPPQ